MTSAWGDRELLAVLVTLEPPRRSQVGAASTSAMAELAEKACRWGGAPR